MGKQAIPSKLQPWIEARRRYHLSDAQIQMARELGLNPKKLGGIANERQERWKMPLGDFIADLYLKRFGKNQPDRVVSIEQQLAEKWERKRDKRDDKPTTRMDDAGDSA